MLNKKKYIAGLLLILFTLSSCNFTSDSVNFNRCNLIGNSSINIQYLGRVAYQEPYFIFSDNKDGLYISNGRDGGQKKILKGNILNVNIIGDWIYFVQISLKKVKLFKTIDNYTLYKCKTDGSEKTKIINDCDTAIVYENEIYYTKHIDNIGYSKAGFDSNKLLEESNSGYLFSCDLNGNNETKLTSEKIYNFILNDNYIYYSGYDETTSYLKRVDLSTMKAEIIINKYVKYFYINSEDIYYSDAFNISKINVSTKENRKLLTANNQVKFLLPHNNGDIVFNDDFGNIYYYSDETKKIIDLKQRGEFIYSFCNNVYYFNDSEYPQKLVLNV